MSRSVGFFWLFCGILLLGGYFLVRWVGPALLQLAFDNSRNDQPYRVLYFLDGSDAQATLAHGDSVERFLTEEGASPLWRTQSLELVDGGLSDEWQQLLAMDFPSAADFVKIATSSKYRKLVGAKAPARMLSVGAHDAPVADPSSYQVLLLYLFSQTAPTADPPALRLGSLATEAGGEIIWQSELDHLTGSDEKYQQLLLVGFHDRGIPAPWLHDPAMVTERALLKTRTRAFAGWIIYQRDAKPAAGKDGGDGGIN